MALEVSILVAAMSNLEVHHKEFRSYSRADSDENLITLWRGMPR